MAQMRQKIISLAMFVRLGCWQNSRFGGNAKTDTERVAAFRRDRITVEVGGLCKSFVQSSPGLPIGLVARLRNDDKADNRLPRDCWAMKGQPATTMTPQPE